MPPDKIAEALERTEWSRDFKWKDISVLAEHLTPVFVPDGEAIIMEGDDERFLAILLSGDAVVMKKDERGRKKRLATIKVGQALGEQSLFDEQRRSASVIAETDCKLLLLTPGQLRYMEVEHPRLLSRILWKFASVMSQRLRNASATVVDLASL
jgi:CRP/FNR family cyclic AMP-dependent transcriptional regulator